MLITLIHNETLTSLRLLLKNLISSPQMDDQFIPKLQEILKSPKKIVVIPHKNPDGDALGSCLALYHYLRTNKHHVNIVSPNEYPAFLKWLPGEKDIICYHNQTETATQLLQKAELIFTLDFNSLSRVGNMEKTLTNTQAVKIMIDHHESPEDYADIMYSDSRMSSTCEMVYHVLNALDSKAFNPEIANCLYTGIMTDTGSFRFSATTAETHQAAAHLITCGAENTKIHQHILDSYSFERLRLLGSALKNLTPIENLPVVFMAITQKQLNYYRYKKGDTEGFVNYGLSLIGIQMSVLMIENESEGKIKMSFRSKGAFSVNDFARNYFDGGGHTNASGGYSLLSMEQTIDKFKSAVVACKDQFEPHA